MSCTKFDFRPRWEAYSAPQTRYLGLRGLLLRGKRGEEGKGKGGRIGEG